MNLRSPILYCGSLFCPFLRLFGWRGSLRTITPLQWATRARPVHEERLALQKNKIAAHTHHRNTIMIFWGGCEKLPPTIQLLFKYSCKRVSFKVNKNELLDLKYIVSVTKQLKLDSNIPEVLEKSKSLDLSLFEALTILELTYVKPALITNLFQVSRNLTKLSIHQSLFSIDELLVVEDETALPFFKEVSTKSYDLTDPVEIQNRRYQDLYDHNLYEILGMVTHLSLRGNALTRIEGLHRLYGLEYLDVGRNNIREIDEVYKLKNLPHLVNLVVEENPLCEVRAYRGLILCSFFENDIGALEFRDFYLDGTSLSQSDMDFVRRHSGSSHTSLRELSTKPTKVKKIKPMKANESTPALAVAPNAKISRSENTSPIIASTSYKESFQRTVNLEQAPVTTVYVDNEERKEDKFMEEKNLKKKIDDLRAEGGNAWLRILNEMNPNPNDTSPPPTTPVKSSASNDLLVVTSPQKKTVVVKKKTRLGKARPKSQLISATTATTTTTASTPTNTFKLPEQTNKLKTTTTADDVWTKPSRGTFRPMSMQVPKSTIQSLDNLSIRSPPEPPKAAEVSSKGPATTSPSITSPVVSHGSSSTSNTLVHNPNSKLICEPFFVVRYGGNQDLLLEIKSDLISETHPTTGNSINTHLLQSIVFIKKFTRAPKELVEITFGKDFKDGLPTVFFKEVYIMEDVEQAELLVLTMRPLIKEYTMSCMDCSERYVVREEYEFGHCIRCKSKYLFYVPVSNSAAPIEVVEPISSAIMSSSYSTPSASSLPSSYANTDNILSRADSDEEFNQRVFTDQNLQLHFRMNLFTGGNQGFTKFETYQFKDIKKVSIGLLYQFFRLELEDICYVFLKRSHDPTHNFLNLLFESARNEGVHLEPYFRISDTMFNIGSLTESKNDFEIFIMLHQKVSSKLVPRSLIVTREKLFLCVENYVQWPLLNKNIKTTSPQFTLVKWFKVTDISSLIYNGLTKPTELTVLFEVENEGKQQWSLNTSHVVECKKIVSTLSKLWKKKFHLDLKINDM
eukprot:gene3713-4279_t